MMKHQAKEVMGRCELSVVNSAGTQAPARHTGTAGKTPAKSGAAAPKPALKKPGFSAKPSDAKEPAGVGAGNGHDRRKKDDDFEEF